MSDPALADALSRNAYLDSLLEDANRQIHILKVKYLSLQRDMVLGKKRPGLSFNTLDQQDLAEAFVGVPVKLVDLHPDSSIAECEGRTGNVVDPTVKQGKVRVKLDTAEEQGSKSITISVHISNINLSEKTGGDAARRTRTNTRASKLLKVRGPLVWKWGSFF